MKFKTTNGGSATRKGTSFTHVLKNSVDLSNLILDNQRITDNLKDTSFSSSSLVNLVAPWITLTDVSFYESTLTGAYFGGTSFVRCDFRNAVLDDNAFNSVDSMDLDTIRTLPANVLGSERVKLLIARNSFIPQTGAFIGYKKLQNQAIATLQIPARAKRSHGKVNNNERKCRASEAKVLKIVDQYGNPVQTGRSTHNPRFIYKVGKMVKPTNGFCEDRWDICAPGIHFFPTFEEAKDYN